MHGNNGVQFDFNIQFVCDGTMMMMITMMAGIGGSRGGGGNSAARNSRNGSHAGLATYALNSDFMKAGNSPSRDLQSGTIHALNLIEMSPAVKQQQNQQQQQQNMLSPNPNGSSKGVNQQNGQHQGKQFSTLPHNHHINQLVQNGSTNSTAMSCATLKSILEGSVQGSPSCGQGSGCLGAYPSPYASTQVDGGGQMNNILATTMPRLFTKAMSDCNGEVDHMGTPIKHAGGILKMSFCQSEGIGPERQNLLDEGHYATVKRTPQLRKADKMHIYNYPGL